LPEGRGVAGKRLNIVVGEDVYVELVRRYGVRGLSRGVDQLLRAALFADNVVNVKAVGVESAKASNVVNVKTDNVVNVETTNVESGKAVSVQSVKTSNVVNVKTDNVQSPVVRRELKVEVPPPRIELPGKPEPPPVPAVAAAEAPEDRAAEGRGGREVEPRERAAPEEPSPAPRGAGPTPKQLQLIESLLKQFGDDWASVREVLLLDKGIEAPEDYRQLSGEALDRVIKALKEWARRPTARELRDARVRAQKLYEQGVELSLPESARDVLRYHLVKLELAETGSLRAKK
jgi:hypothetical protein